MKKLLISVLTILMFLTISGCGNKNRDPKPDPKPQPQPQQVDEKFVSKTGTDETIEKMLEEFNSTTKGWKAFFTTQDENYGAMFYDCWDNEEVYQGNYRDYIAHSYNPVSELVVYYDKGNRTGNIMSAYVWLPYEPIKNMGFDQFDAVEKWMRLVVKALLPDLTEAETEKLIDKIAAPTADAYEAFIRGNSDPAELEATSIDVYEPDSDKPLRTIGCRYDEEYQTILLEYKIKE